MRKKIKDPQSGFTIIESLISLILLAIVITGGMQFYFNAQKIVSLASHKKIAIQIANTRLEEIRRNGYGSLEEPATGVPQACPTAVTVGGLSATCTEATVAVD